MKKERFFKPMEPNGLASSDLGAHAIDTLEPASNGRVNAQNDNAEVSPKLSPDAGKKIELESKMPQTLLFVEEDDIYEVPASSASARAEDAASSNKTLEASVIGDSAQNSELAAASNQVLETDAETLLSVGQTDSSEPDQRPSRTLEEMGFDLFKSQIEPIIGNVSPRDLQHLYKRYFNRPNYIQQASNEYFNGIDYGASGSIPAPSSRPVSSSQGDPGMQKMAKEEQIRKLVDRIHTQHEIDSREREARSWKRYIGTLDVEAWATRPYMRLLTYQQPLEVKRLKPNKIKKLLIVTAKFGDSAVIRLYTKSDSREIGRLPEDVTRILSPLIDLDLANFEALVILETRGRLSIGDSFYVQIRCYLNNNTFAEHALYDSSQTSEGPTKKRKTAKPGSFNALLETEGETVLRLKQKLISRLFEKLGLTKADPRVDLEADSSSSQGSTPNPEPQASEDLNLDQLKEFYLSNQQSAYLENLPETTTPPPENFALLLRTYQKHGLAWMLSREQEMDLLQELSRTDNEDLSTQRMQTIRQQDEGVLNPLWNEYRWPQDRLPDGTIALNESRCFYANLYNGEFSLHKPVVHNFLKGGILADEMGLGKTILTLALVHSLPYDVESAPVGFRPYASKTTLIIVPMSLLSQWKAEFDRTNSNRNHRCHVHYGDTVQADLSFMLCNRSENIPIVVLTTYGMVQNEWARLNKIRDDAGRLPPIGLFSVEFFRIVLDEGHTIRNRTTKTAKSVHELELRRKWILTGTPVVNRLDDIFSLVKFLRLDPWCNFSYWKTFVTLPFEQKKFNQTLDVVKSILQPIFLRRTKNMKQKDGTPLVLLPDKEVIIEQLGFSDKEQLYYDFFKSKAHQSFAEGLKTGDLLKKYTQILTHILRLRQVCCHPDLIASSSELDETWEEELAEYEKPVARQKFALETAMKQTMYGLYKVVQIEDSECSICTLAPIAIGELTVTECGHQYCFHCLMDHFQYQKNEGSEPLCPQCRCQISKYRLFKVSRREVSKKEVRFHTNEPVHDPHACYPFQLYHFNPDRSSAKIQALVTHLRELEEQSPGEQVVVFSQFSTFLDLIENELKSLGGDNEGFVVYKFDGRLNMADREKVLQKFSAQNSADGRITVLLLSLKAGGVGLNLTVARRAYMMDPWWSPSIEDQAIDRVHRIGQVKNVKVVRFIVRNSIEEKMLRIQERKRMMGEAVEVEEEERRKQRIEEIKLLFDE